MQYTLMHTQRAQLRLQSRHLVKQLLRLVFEQIQALVTAEIPQGYTKFPEIESAQPFRVEQVEGVINKSRLYLRQLRQSRGTAVVFLLAQSNAKGEHA